MISIELAWQLSALGVRWHPRSGDRFTILQPELSGEVFTISDMMVEAHEFPTGTVLGFNGTTEWALDSVAQDDALWLPGEDQLRTMLGGTFRSLVAADGSFLVTIRLPSGIEKTCESAVAADAYAQALLALVGQAVGASPA
ncbi:MAG TPA: pilus assembly protein CpaE [Pengzhenrongella sp.]